MIEFRNKYEENEKLFSTGDEDLDDLLQEVYYSGIEDGYDYAQREFTKVRTAKKYVKKGTKKLVEMAKAGHSVEEIDFANNLVKGAPKGMFRAPKTKSAERGLESVMKGARNAGNKAATPEMRKKGMPSAKELAAEAKEGMQAITKAGGPNRVPGKIREVEAENRRAAEARRKKLEAANRKMKEEFAKRRLDEAAKRKANQAVRKS